MSWTLVPPGGGEVIGDSPERRVEILSDHPSLNATWSRFATGLEGADLHVHRRHSDVFYVLAGELTVRLGIADEAVVVPAGILARVPPGVVHGFRNGSDAELRYLNFHAPGMRFADYLRGLRDGRPFSYDQHEPPADGGRSPADAVIGRSELVTNEPGLQITRLADIEEIEVTETWCAAGAAPVARRPARLESLYVLEGELTFPAGRAAAGSWVQPPVGATYACEVTRGPARFLTVTSPAG